MNFTPTIQQVCEFILTQFYHMHIAILHPMMQNDIGKNLITSIYVIILRKCVILHKSYIKGKR